MSVSLVMIVRDEADNLRAALESVKGVGLDEIVVVDTGSIDDTRAVATSCGAKVFDFAWCDDFSAARNEAIRHAHGDWIFWMDADDRLPPSSKEPLTRLLRSLGDENAGYLMTVSCPGPDGGPMFELLHVRLFRNRPEVRWVRRVHEQIAIAVQRAGGELRPTGVQIVHVGYVARGARERKMERNLRLVEIELAEQPFDPFLLETRATTLLGLDRSAEALVALSWCGAAPLGSATGRNLAALTIEALVQEERLDDALEAARDGLRRSPRDAKLCFLEAQLLAAMGWLVEAEVAARAHLIVGEEHPQLACADRSIFAFRVRHLLAEVLLRLGRGVEAEEEARAAVAARPSFGAAWLTLGDALLAQGRALEALALGDGWGVSREADVGRAIVRARVCVREARCEDAVRMVDAALVAAPGHPMALGAWAEALHAAGFRGPGFDEVLQAALRTDRLSIRLRAIERAVRPPVGAARHVRLAERADTALGPLLP